MFCTLQTVQWCYTLSCNPPARCWLPWPRSTGKTFMSGLQVAKKAHVLVKLRSDCLSFKGLAIMVMSDQIWMQYRLVFSLTQIWFSMLSLVHLVMWCNRKLAFSVYLMLRSHETRKKHQASIEAAWKTRFARMKWRELSIQCDCCD